MISAFDTTAKVDAAFAELKAYWDRLLDIYVVKTDEEKLDRMVNIWNQYQCMITFNMSRSASFFESGIGRGMGFRDSNQDLVGFVHQIPERARERIIDIASTQFPDGGCYHQYQPLTKRGNNDIGGGFNDDPCGLSSVRWHTSRNRETSVSWMSRPLRQQRRFGSVSVRAPARLLQPRHREPRPPHVAPHRPCRLERLPEPELLLLGSE